jgi:hypothetical protein
LAFLFALCILRQTLLFDFAGCALVFQFRCRKITQQLSDLGVRGARRCMLVESTGVLLHLSCLLPHGFNALQADLPKPLPLNETAHVLASDERDVAAKF